MLIRRERAGDILAIDAVHRRAFARDYPDDLPGETPRAAADPAEVALVHRLRSDSGWIPTLSMVAEVRDRVVGHVCLTRAGVGPYPVLALGPIGVLPDHQGEGVGAPPKHPPPRPPPPPPPPQGRPGRRPPQKTPRGVNPPPPPRVGP
ncbi:GNAT family N-acetyltransferase, partial [Nocardia wallacei]|uniref:GNAT family N-acetyltransferase n=1 Tax=Nocardia wallacei TaxID=480035 RepID=UPI00313ECC30